MKNILSKTMNIVSKSIIVFVFTLSVLFFCFINTAIANPGNNISSATCYCQACPQPEEIIPGPMCRGEVEPEDGGSVYCNENGFFIDEFKGGFNRCNRNSKVKIRGRETTVLEYCQINCRRNTKVIYYKVGNEEVPRKANVFKTIKYSDG
ncbi:hypothetical protein KKF63_12105 [bacterium]|nr:hypothetical protein [bacterium]